MRVKRENEGAGKKTQEFPGTGALTDDTFFLPRAKEPNT